MPIFIMFGKYSAAAMKGMSADRTKKAISLLKKQGGKVKEMYALLGEKDLLLIVDFPGLDKAIKASVALGQMTGIAFATCPAVTVEEFDKLISQA
jgi:uncharacterized protein with GYD domain